MEVDKTFKRTTNTIKKELSRIKRSCERDQKTLTRTEWIQYIVSLKEKEFPTLNKHFLVLNEITKNFDKDEFEMHKKYLRANLLECFPSAKVRQVGGIK